MSLVVHLCSGQVQSKLNFPLTTYADDIPSILVTPWDALVKQLREEGARQTGGVVKYRKDPGAGSRRKQAKAAETAAANAAGSDQLPHARSGGRLGKEEGQDLTWPSGMAGLPARNMQLPAYTGLQFAELITNV